MKKLLVILFILCISLLLVSCGGKKQVKKSLDLSEPEHITTQEKTDYVAVLNELSGEVQINDQPAQQDQQIKKGDFISTQEGEATILFADSSELRLDKHTQITLDTMNKENDEMIIDLSQESGSTWSRLLKVSGINTYNIQTPNTVATVRGTGFGVTVTNEETEVMVDEGEVEVSRKENNNIVERQRLFADDKAKIKRAVAKKMLIESMKDNDRAMKWIRKNRDKDGKLVDKIAQKLVESDKGRAKNIQTTEQAKRAMKKYLVGKMNRDDLLKEAMVSKDMQKTLPMGSRLNQDPIRKVVVEMNDQKRDILSSQDSLLQDIEDLDLMVKDIEDFATLLAE